MIIKSVGQGLAHNKTIKVPVLLIVSSQHTSQSEAGTSLGWVKHKGLSLTALLPLSYSLPKPKAELTPPKAEPN